MGNPPEIIDIDGMKSIKDKILFYDFKKSNVLNRFGVKNYTSWERENEEMPSNIWKYLSGSPADDLDILIRLLVLNQEIEKNLIGNIFSPDEIGNLLKSKIINNSSDNKHFFSEFSMFEFDGFLFVTDSIINESKSINPVMPLLPESYELGEMQIKQNVGKTLDLGTGSGVQAIIASRHSEKVIGVDINPRAIAFSKFNASLNNIHNTEFFVSDLFSAADGQTFDLIISNPPYMPDTNYTPGDNFFCGGENGDSIWSRIIRELDRFLNEDGICQIIHMIISLGDETYKQKVSRLLGENANKYSVVLVSKQIDFRNENTRKIYSSQFGITNLKKHKYSHQYSYSEIPYISNSINIIDSFKSIWNNDSGE